MSKPIPLQLTFETTLVDTRNRRQRKAHAKRTSAFKQQPMFSQRDLAHPCQLTEIGNRKRDGSPIGFTLVQQDGRTQQEKDEEKQRNHTDNHVQSF